MSDTEAEEKQIETATDDEVQRLKNLETSQNSLKQTLDAQLAKNAANEQLFARLSAMLGEVLLVNARTTYIATMVKDMIDNRNKIT